MTTTTAADQQDLLDRARKLVRRVRTAEADAAAWRERALAAEAAVPADTGSPYLTSFDLADRYHAPVSTIRYWRHLNYGPLGVKVGRRVLYRLDDVEAWERQMNLDGGAP